MAARGSTGVPPVDKGLGWAFNSIELKRRDEKPTIRSDTAITEWVWTKALDGDDTTCWRMMRDSKQGGDKAEPGKLVRLIKPKQIASGRNMQDAEIKRERVQQQQALIAYTLMVKDNDKPCTTCAHKLAKGPCQDCVAGTVAGETMWGGACTNCQYSSTANLCSFRAGEKSTPQKRKRTDSSLLGRIIKGMAPDDLKELRDMCDKELTWKRKRARRLDDDSD